MESEIPVPVPLPAPSPAPAPAALPERGGPAWTALLRRLEPRAPLLLLLAALAALAALAPLGLWDPWETRVAELARPLAGGKAAAQAAGAVVAPLQAWLIRGSLGLFGVHEVAVRLPGALLGLALLAALLGVGRRRWGLPVALAAGVALLCSPHFLLQAGLALGNMPLMACQGLLLLLLEWAWPVAAAAGVIACATPPCGEADRRRWLAPAAVAAGAGTLLAGGLLGLALPTAVVGCGWLLDRRAPRKRAAALALLAVLLAAGVAVALAPRGSWLAALGPDLSRLTGPPGKEKATFEHFGYLLACGFFHWSALLPAGLVVLARRGAGAPADRDGAALLLLWLGFGFVFANAGLLLGGPDVFPALPAAAIAVGLLAAARPAASGVTIRWLFAASFVFLLWMVGEGLVQQPGAWLTGLVSGTFAFPENIAFPGLARLPVLGFALLVLVHALQPGAWSLPGWLARPLARLGARLPAAVRRWTVQLRGLERREVALPGVALCGLALVALLATVFVPRLTYSVSERSVLDAWRRAGAPAGDIATYLVPPELSPFYLGSLPRWSNRNEFLERFAAPGPAFAVIPRDRLAEVNNDFRGRTQRHLVVLDDRSAKLLLVANALPAGERDRNAVSALLLDAAPTPQHPVHAVLEGSLELLGADFSRPGVPVGGRVVITTYYKVLRPLPRAWKVFLHVETPTFRIDTGSTDHAPAGGIFATSAWRTGDIVKDVYELHVPFFSPLGTYTVRSGLFVGDDRMKVDQADKHDGKDRISLGELRVTAL